MGGAAVLSRPRRHRSSRRSSAPRCSPPPPGLRQVRTITPWPGCSVSGAMGMSRSRFHVLHHQHQHVLRIARSRTARAERHAGLRIGRPEEALKGQVAKSGPNSSRKTACTTWLRVDRIPTSASPPAPLAGAAATMAGSTAGRFRSGFPQRDAEDEEVPPDWPDRRRRFSRWRSGSTSRPG